jgi:FkbM family methyltransferase
MTRNLHVKAHELGEDSRPEGGVNPRRSGELEAAEAALLQTRLMPKATLRTVPAAIAPVRPPKPSFLVEPKSPGPQYRSVSEVPQMSHSSYFGLKPAYLFTPKTLVRRMWTKFFPPRCPQKVVRLPWGTTIEINVTETIGSEIFKQGIFDIGVSECAWRMLQPGDHVLDAGANIGYMTSLFASKVGKQGVVHSFEPHPRIREKLTSNITRFAHDGTIANIIVHGCALGDVTGVASLVETADFASNQGSAFLADGEADGKVAARHQVDVSLLDDVVPTGKFGLLKIDVEGHELKLIQGAQKLLSQQRVRHVIYEDHSQGKTGLPEIFSRHGYTIYSIGHTLFGLDLRDWKNIVLDTTWESPSYLATIDPGYVESHKSKGWQIFKGV